MRPDGACKSCGAKMRWAVSASSGQRIPLDAEANPNGNLGVVEWRSQLNRAGAAWPLPVVAVNPTRTLTEYRYLSHFVTCPNAADHRSRKR